ncbi:hypothetical protein TNCV_4966641 [Trichonephila clavipes]|nr:hypothetical protein TNCV_4966641 [Trichonephila clavipes]
MPGKHAGYSIRKIPSSKRKSSIRLARGGLQLSSIKIKSSAIAAAIIPTVTVSLDENTPIIRMNRKTGLVRKKNIAAPFISPPVHMFCCPLPAVATMT